MTAPKDDTMFSYEQHNRHILFCGTQLMQGRSEANHNYMKAVVIRTGKIIKIQLTYLQKFN